MAEPASLENIAQTLKSARQRQGLSQRTLAAKIGVLQSYISKIENAGVDLQTSSLIDIARALELELMLVPRRLIPAVQALQRQGVPDTPPEFESSVHANLNRVLGSLDRVEALPEGPKALTQLDAIIQSLRPLRYSAEDGVQIQSLLDRITNVLKTIHRTAAPSADKQIGKEALRTLTQYAQELRAIRNRIVHPSRDQQIRAVPAYQLDADDDNG